MLGSSGSDAFLVNLDVFVDKYGIKSCDWTGMVADTVRDGFGGACSQGDERHGEIVQPWFALWVFEQNYPQQKNGSQRTLPRLTGKEENLLIPGLPAVGTLTCCRSFYLGHVRLQHLWVPGAVGPKFWVKT